MRAGHFVTTNLPPSPPTPHELAVLEAIRATPFGTVEVVLHQARIVQVVRTEKVRLDTSAD